MSKHYTVSNLVLSVFAHSTEDLSRVKQAVLNVLPQQLRENVLMEEQVVHGHYGNPITLITVRLKSREDEDSVFRHILCSLSITDRSLFTATLGRRVGSKNSIIYLRLSKQDAFSGKVMLMDGDDVIKVTATVVGVKSLRDLHNYLKEVFEECGSST
ncbi:MAG: RNA-binding domain-containing protein [Desulfurococcaceae archaeon TW002]